VNDIGKEVMDPPEDLNTMYLLASRRVVVCNNQPNVGGATFATLEEDRRKRDGKRNGNRNKNNNKKDGKGKSEQDKREDKLKIMKCFNCLQKGHLARDCPENNEDDDEPEPLAGMTYQREDFVGCSNGCCATGKQRKRLHKIYEVCIDNGSQVNIVHPVLLRNLRTSTKTYQSMNGGAVTSQVGLLEGFFECQACEDCPANIISQSDVEELYHMTYVHGESITVHMGDRDIIFYKKDKMYVADFSEWIQKDSVTNDYYEAGDIDLVLMTAQERESLYTKKEVERAREAGEFEKEAVHLIRDGNLVNVPYSVDDIRRYYTIYGPQVAAVRGKTTKQHAKSAERADMGAMEQQTMQELCTDVMYAAGEKFLISVCSPLELTIVSHTESLSMEALGGCLQKQINLLRSRGFEARRVLVDPHKSLVGLAGSFPGTTIDAVGAGDHLDKVDAKIRRVKETMRSIIAVLPYRLAKARIKDLVTYVVSRMNVRRTSALTDNVCPRVKFTGVKVDYKKEFGLAFGDYVEAYNPRAEKESNNILVARTEPCIERIVDDV
jgi:hypothetical protein